MSNILSFENAKKPYCFMRVFLLLFGKMHRYLLPGGVDLRGACAVYLPPPGEGGHQRGWCDAKGIVT